MDKKQKANTILIIEDDPQIRQFVSWALEMEGYQVLQAEDGEEGLRLIRQKEVALVLLDLRLPGRDGWSVLKEIKGTPELSAIPVVMLTASAAELTRETAISSGATDYLTKPVSANSLSKAISRILRPNG